MGRPERRGGRGVGRRGAARTSVPEVPGHDGGAAGHGADRSSARPLVPDARSGRRPRRPAHGRVGCGAGSDRRFPRRRRRRRGQRERGPRRRPHAADAQLQLDHRRAARIAAARRSERYRYRITPPQRGPPNDRSPDRDGPGGDPDHRRPDRRRYRRRRCGGRRRRRHPSRRERRQQGGDLSPGAGGARQGSPVLCLRRELQAMAGRAGAGRAGPRGEGRRRAGRARVARRGQAQRLFRRHAGAAGHAQHHRGGTRRLQP